MSKLDEPLKQFLREQIALEEHLHSVLRQQISELNEKEFADAKNLLINVKEVLEQQFLPLNEKLEQLETDLINIPQKASTGNGKALFEHSGNPDRRATRVSRILRDNYCALNLITMSNTLLHTTALALNNSDVAAIALKHLENLAPLVVKIGELVPYAVARELHKESPKVDLSIGKIALENSKLAWRNAI